MFGGRERGGCPNKTIVVIFKNLPTLISTEKPKQTQRNKTHTTPNPTEELDRKAFAFGGQVCWLGRNCIHEKVGEIERE